MQRKYVLNDKLFSLEIVNDLQISAVILVYRRFSCGYTSLHLHQIKITNNFNEITLNWI